jgi:hypothetical protein
MVECHLQTTSLPVLCTPPAQGNGGGILKELMDFKVDVDALEG